MQLRATLRGLRTIARDKRTAMLLSIVGLVVLAALSYVGLARGQATSLDIFGDAPAFALIDHLERPVSSEDLRGTVVVANFIYTNCQDICPLLSFRMQALQDRLRQDGLLGSQVQLLSFTVDPARDTPPVLRAYAERYRVDTSAWRFLTGPERQLVPLVVDGFRLGVRALPPATVTPDGHDRGHGAPEGYDVMHSGRFVLIDRQWRIRAYYDGTDLDLDRVLSDVRQLLR